MARDSIGRKTCVVHGCAKPAMFNVYCVSHFAANRGAQREVRAVMPSGYIRISGIGHPLAKGRDRRVYEHRKVFFDHYGEGPFHCHVCGLEVTWNEMHVDHLDDNRANNAVSNLAAAHPRCNVLRVKNRKQNARKGPFTRWIEYQGERLAMSEWAERLGLPKETLQWRLNNWPLERAMTERHRPNGAARRDGAVHT